jgi:NADPH2:quinone reductase
MLVFNATPEELAAVHAGIGSGLAAGTVRPVIARELSLAEAPAAHRAVMSPGAKGKIVLTP